MVVVLYFYIIKLSLLICLKIYFSSFLVRKGIDTGMGWRHLPTILSIFFCSVRYKKIEGKGWMIDSNKTSCYVFDYKSGNLNYLSQHSGDFTKSGFSWADSRIAEFEDDKLTPEHLKQAKNTAQRVYNYLQEENQKTSDQNWEKEHQHFLSPLERILNTRT